MPAIEFFCFIYCTYLADKLQYGEKENTCVLIEIVEKYLFL